jgi:hypothetical protein
MCNNSWPIGIGPDTEVHVDNSDEGDTDSSDEGAQQEDIKEPAKGTDLNEPSANDNIDGSNCGGTNEAIGGTGNGPGDEDLRDNTWDGKDGKNNDKPA